MNMEHRETITEMDRPYNSSFHKLMKMFTLSVLISFAGTYFGTEFLPPAIVLPLVIVEFIMLISAFFIRRNKRPIGYGFVFAFSFISGVTIFPAIQAYTLIGGSALIQTAFLLTAVIFGALTLYAYYSKRDFSFLRGFLMVGLLTVIGFSLVNLFVPFGTGLGTIIAGAGVLLFSGFILYDVSQYRHGLSEEYIPMAVLNLYLDFINLFLFLLRLLGLSRD